MERQPTVNRLGSETSPYLLQHADNPVDWYPWGAETLDWALRDLRQEEGGFASALDADSEGEEGRFYVWTPDEVRAALDDDRNVAEGERDEGASRLAGETEIALEHFGMTRPPNFEGRWTPVRATPDPERIDEIKARLRASWPTRSARASPTPSTAASSPRPTTTRR